MKKKPPRYCPKLFAPVAPFAEAIEAWLAYQERLAGGRLNQQVGRNNTTDNVTIAGLGVLAQMAGSSPRTLNGYRRGEYRLIELRAADRLANALDIPLPLLADDFRPQSAWAAAELEVAA